MSLSLGLVRARLVLVALIWAGTFVAGRGVSHAAPPLVASFTRFAIASLALSAIMALGSRALPRPTPRQWLRIGFLGLVGIYAYNLCFFEGLRSVSASRASLIIALNPALIALAAHLFAGERLDRARVLGVAAGFVGVAIIVIGRDPAAVVAYAVTSSVGGWSGDLAIFGCVLSWVVYSVFARPAIAALGALPTVFYSVLAGTLALGLHAIASGSLNATALGSYGAGDWARLGYLGVLGSAVAYVWYYEAIRRLGATRAGVFIALNPVFGVALGALLLDEVPTWPMLGGGALAVCGVYLCNRPAGEPSAT